MRRRWMERFKTLLVFATVSVVVVLAVAATALRLAVAYAPELRAETESYLGGYLGRAVEIGGLRAEWQGFDPRLIFEDVTVEGEGNSRYRFAELEVALSARELITNQRVVPSEVAVDGVELTLERLPGGELELSADRAPSFLTALPARIRVRDATVRIIDHIRADVYALTQAHLLFDGRGSRQRLSVSAELPAFIGQRAEFILEWTDFDDPFADARLYADLSGVQVDALQEIKPAMHVIPGLRGSGDMELWLELSDDRLVAASGRVSMQQLGARQQPGESWFDIGQRLEARFDWRQENDGWALDVDEIGYLVDRDYWPTSGLSVRYQAESADEPERWRAGVEYIELTRLRQLLAQLPRVPEPLREWAQSVELGGELRQAGFQVRHRDGMVTRYAARGTLTGGRYVTHDGRVAATGIDVSFTANERGGEARINGRDGALTLQRLFRQPLEYRRLEAEAAWARDDTGWRVALGGLSMRNAEASVRGNVRLFDLGSGNPFLDVRASVKRFDGAATSRYLPTGIMRPDLVRWLDQAIQGGRVEGAELLLFGRARDFPFRDGDGVFEVSGRVVDGQLRYFPEWPVVRDVTADLRFSSQRMRITAQSGKLFDLDVGRVVAEIPDLDNATLSVNAGVAGPGGDFLAFSRHAPITRRLKPDLEMLRLAGRHRLDLKLALPLADIDASRVNGALTLSDGVLSVPEVGVAVAALNGTVNFDENGLDIDTLTGRWRGRAVNIDAATDGTIDVNARLTAGPEAFDLAEQDYVSGEAQWAIEARFPSFQGNAESERVPVNVRSDLTGMRVNLPQPLGKSAAEERPFWGRFTLMRGGMSPLRLQYGERVTALADVAGGLDAARFGVRFGSGIPELPEERGVRVTGALDHLDLPRAALSEPNEGLGVEQAFFLPAWVDVSVDRLAVAGQVFESVALAATRRADGWTLNFDGPELAGEVDMPRGDAGSPIDVDLRHLYLSKAGFESQADENARLDSTPVLPSMDVSIGELYLDDRLLGEVSAAVVSGARQTQLEHFSLDNEVIKIAGRGRWQWDMRSEHTWVEAEFDSVDVGEALALFGYAKTVDDGEAHGSLRLNWRGGPTAMAPGKLGGNLAFTLRKGRLPDVEPGAGRVFGLLSLATIPRRLTLDFSDLFQEGFSFDKIKARFQLVDGYAMPEEFYIEGPAARIDFSGEIDLAKQRFDQILTITPQVSSALPLIGGLTGGPVAAVVLFVTQQIFQDEMDRLARYQYRVTGPWADPEIEPIRRPRPDGLSDNG